MLTEVDITQFASYRWGEKRGLEKGEKKGSEIRAKSIAVQLLKGKLLSPEQIATATSLPLETIHALHKSLEH